MYRGGCRDFKFTKDGERFRVVKTCQDPSTNGKIFKLVKRSGFEDEIFSMYSGRKVTIDVGSICQNVRYVRYVIVAALAMFNLVVGYESVGFCFANERVALRINRIIRYVPWARFCVEGGEGVFHLFAIVNGDRLVSLAILSGQGGYNRLYLRVVFATPRNKMTRAIVALVDIRVNLN